MTKFSAPPTRRHTLVGVLAGAMVATRAHGRTLDWADPAARLDAVIRVIGRSDGGITVRWTDGVLTAHIESETTALFRVMSQIYSRHRARADGGYDAVIIEVVYFADLDTRELLENWRNPFTGETVPVPQTTLGPTRYVIPPSLLVEREPIGIAGARLEHRLEIEDRVGDDIWITETVASHTPPMAAGQPPFGFHETFTYHARQSDLAQTERAHVPCAVQKTNMLSWRPWMQMGSRPGRTVTRGYGRVLDDPAQLPQRFIDLNRVHSQAIVDDLDTYLAF